MTVQFNGATYIAANDLHEGDEALCVWFATGWDGWVTRRATLRIRAEDGRYRVVDIIGYSERERGSGITPVEDRFIRRPPIDVPDEVSPHTILVTMGNRTREGALAAAA